MDRDREIADIPEVFRRAFEDEGWNNFGGGDEGDGGGRGGGGGGQPWWISRWLWIGLILFLILISFNWIVTTYTEWLWFNTLEYASVWLTQWGLRIGAFVIFFVIAALILLFNWRYAFYSARQAGKPGRLRLLDLPGMRWLVYAGGAFMAFIFGSAAGAQWERFLLYYYRQPFGVDDPIFNLDLGFYLFELPVYRLLHGWLMPLIIITLLGVVGLHFINNWVALQRGRWRPVFSPNLRRHIAALGTVLFLLWAAGLVLDVYELLYSPRGVAFGASYTDLNATLPVLYIQIGLMLILAITTALAIFRPTSLRPVAIVGGLWILVTLAGGNLYPGILQRYAVEPNELARERPYIDHNIEFTRLAFGLDKIAAQPFGDVSELSRADLEGSEPTLRNIRLWDYRPLQQTYAQLQELRPYYEFSSIDIDRYELDGEVRQVMLAGRELNKQNLSAPSWVNQKLEFTHGYGVVMNPVDRVTPEGRPDFFIQDLPPVSNVSLEVNRPEIYYGELMTDIVFAGSDLEEFDYPVGTQNAYSSYAGEGGVPISNLLRRLAFSIRFGEVNLMLSDYITPETRVLMHRQIRERVRQITPFLSLDDDPYLVVADGQLVWMLDAYTLSQDFPYSSPTEQGFNYIRNAAKITINAYDGAVNYYTTAPEDPLLQAYALAFPDLFQPLEAMPDVLRDHIRYPEDLFVIQTRQYLKYHMTDTQVFYNQEDLWEIPQEIFDSNQQPIEPYYVIMSLPGQEDTEFLLIQPYTPAGRNNMIAWLAARNDAPNYGELVVFELPKQELVFGPIQVEARIDQDPQISAQISLWNQRGSRVIRGNLLVIPINDSFLYVEPLYLLADTSELPELKRVIVASGNRLAMRETLAEALVALVEGEPAVAAIVEEPPVGGAGEAGESESGAGVATQEPGPTVVIPTATTPAGQVADETIQELIRSADAHFAAAQAAQRAGDWATYGNEIEALEADLTQLIELANQP